MVIHATVIEVNPRNLLVNDHQTGNEIMVHSQKSGNFSIGDHIKITHNGQMTRSIPPQISAISIERLTRRPQSRPTEMRAVILRRGRGFIFVRNLHNGTQMRVNYAHAHHFCVGQRVIIKHDTIIMNNPPEANAVDIEPIC